MVSGGAYPGSVPVSVTQYMQVLSPNGGETYHVGDTVNITWKNCFTSVQSPLTIGISLIDFNASSGHQAIPIGNAVQIANGSYSFTIPATIVAYGATISMNGSNYKIGIMDGMVGANGGHGDTSDASFTILP